MSDKESEKAAPEEESKEPEAPKALETKAPEHPPFVENDRRETALPYHPEGRAPWPVMAVWATLIIGFFAYMIYYALPDLTKWGRP